MTVVQKRRRVEGSRATASRKKARVAVKSKRQPFTSSNMTLQQKTPVTLWPGQRVYDISMARGGLGTVVACSGGFALIDYDAYGCFWDLVTDLLPLTSPPRGVNVS